MRSLLQLLLVLLAGLLVSPSAAGSAGECSAVEIWSASGLTESSVESGDIASAERQGTDWNEEKDDDDEASVGFEPSASPRLRVLGRVRHLTLGHTPAFDGKQEARAPPLS